MYWINGNNHEMVGGCRAFYADSIDDVDNLPTSTREGVQQGNDTISCKKVKKGSTCLVINPASYFTLNSEDEWKQM